MSNQEQTPPSVEGHQAPPAAEEPNKQAQGAEIQPVAPEHEVKPETAHDESSLPKDVKPA